MVLKRSKFGINSGNSFGSYLIRENLNRRAFGFYSGSLVVTYRIPVTEYDRSGTALQETSVRRVEHVLSRLQSTKDVALLRLGKFNRGRHEAVARTSDLSLDKKKRWLLADKVLHAVQSNAFKCDDVVADSRPASGKYAYRSVSDCGVSLAVFGCANSSRSSSCLVYANSDAPTRVVFANKRFERIADFKGQYGDFRDMLNAAYNGALGHIRQRKRNDGDEEEEETSDDGANSARQPVRNPHHNAHFRGVQRPAALRVEASRYAAARRLRRHDKSRPQRISKTQFDVQRPADRAEVRISVIQPRGLTTESCYRRYRHERLWSETARVNKRTDVQSLAAEDRFLTESCAYDDDSAQSVPDVLPDDPRRCFDLTQFVVKKQKQPKRGKKQHCYVDALDNDSPKCVLVVLADNEQASDADDAKQVDQREHVSAVDTACQQLETERQRAAQLTIQDSETHPTKLATVFGEQYAETHSLPRVIMLDLLANDLAMELEANLLVSLFESSGNSTAQVRLNVHAKRTVSDNAQSEFARLVNNTGLVNDIEQFYNNVANMLRQLACSDNQIQVAANKLSTRVLLKQVPTNLSAVNTQACCQQQVSSDDECAICCYEALEPVRLCQCDHVFCRQCLARYVATIALDATGRTVECAAYKCSTQLDKVTLCNLLSSATYYGYVQRLRQSEVSRRRNGLTWCPNEQCSSVVKLLESKRRNVCTETVCSLCNTGFCFDCGAEAHYPVTCEERDMFVDVLRCRGQLHNRVASEFSLSRVTTPVVKVAVYMALVKRCSQCRNVMEKNGGCQHMRCPCGHDFCWECLGDWSEHCRPGFSWNCASHKQSEKQMEVMEDPVVVRRNWEEHFRLAMLFRTAAHDQLRRLQRLRTLQVQARDCASETVRFLQVCEEAEQALLDSLRFMHHVHAFVFVWTPELQVRKHGSSLSKLPRRLNALTVTRRLREPLDTLHFGLLLINGLLSELLSNQELYTVMLGGTIDSLISNAALFDRAKLKKLSQVTATCRQHLQRCRALTHYAFEAVRC